MKNRLIGLALCLSFTVLPALAEESIAQSLENVKLPFTMTGQAKVSATSIEAANQVHIQKTLIPLNSKLKKKYAAYRVVLTSDYPRSLKLVSGVLENGISGQIAADSVHTSTAWAFVGLIGFIGGLLVIGLPTFLIINAKNKKAENEATSYSNQIPSFMLSKGQSVTFNALVPSAQTPQINLTLQDIETNEMLPISSL